MFHTLDYPKLTGTSGHTPFGVGVVTPNCPCYCLAVSPEIDSSMSRLLTKGNGPPLPDRSWVVFHRDFVRSFKGRGRCGVTVHI